MEARVVLSREGVAYPYHDVFTCGQLCGACGFYRGADKSLARPGRKQATATEDFEFHILCL